MPFCQVIVDINHTDVDHVFTYRVPAGLNVCPGMRVHVPFGPRKLEGVVVEMAADCDLPPERVKDICDTLEDYPAVLAFITTAVAGLRAAQRDNGSFGNVNSDAMVIAGLAAKGVTEVEQVQNIERGYETLVEKFVALGADMYRSEIPESAENK